MLVHLLAIAATVAMAAMGFFDGVAAHLGMSEYGDYLAAFAIAAVLAPLAVRGM